MRRESEVQDRRGLHDLELSERHVRRCDVHGYDQERQRDRNGLRRWNVPDVRNGHFMQRWRRLHERQLSQRDVLPAHHVRIARDPLRLGERWLRRHPELRHLLESSAVPERPMHLRRERLRKLPLRDPVLQDDDAVRL
jgi:hypothetical protein